MGYDEQYAYNPDRQAPRDQGLRVVHSEEEKERLQNPDGTYVKGVSVVYVVSEFPKFVYKASKEGAGYITKQVKNKTEEDRAAKSGYAVTAAEIHAILDPLFAPKVEE
jgi:hypothetical protein